MELYDQSEAVVELYDQSEPVVERYDQSEPVVEPYEAARDAPMKGKFELSYVDGIKFNKNTVWRCKLDPGLKASTTPVSNFDGSSDTQCFQLEAGS